MKGPLVSVIIPTYDRSSVIGRTIENVLQQTYSNLEVIVVDDGSTDDTHSVLNSYGERIQWIAQENAGPAAARNRGIAISHGEILTFQDSDDLWKPTKIERQVALLQRAGPSVPCCLCNTTMNFAVVTTSFESAPIAPALGEGIWTNAAEILATRCILFNQAVAVRREALEKVGGFDESLWSLEDYDLALKLSIEGPWTFIREPLVVWCGGMANSLYQKTSVEQISLKENHIKIHEGFLARLGDLEQFTELRKMIRREIKRDYRQLRATKLRQMGGWSSMVAGDFLHQVEHWRSSLFGRSPWCPKMEVVALDGGG
jgi:glycosyltransferase involved in cell wall biosynthesis